MISSRTRWMIATTMMLICSGGALAQPKAEAPITADVIKEADAARKRGDLVGAFQRFEAARKARDFAAARPPVDLILMAGDYHFAQSTLDSQEQALATYDLALSIYGKDLGAFDVAQVRTRRAEVLSWQGKTDLARDEITALRTAYKDDRRVNLLADLGSANLLLLANQADAARTALLPLTEIDDPIITPGALFSLGRAYVQLKQPEQAVNTFRSLWNRYGDSDFIKRAVYLIGQVYFDRGDFLEARKLYEACAVVGAAMQTTVRVGDELIVKVSDPDYYARTRSQVLLVKLTVPSGDVESLRLEKNQVSDSLYIGRIQTALLLPNPSDNQLQVAGSDTITLSYEGQSGKPYQVRVVDDGSIQIDSVALAEPRPRHERSLPQPTRSRPTENAEPIVIPTGRLSSGAVSPGSPVYVQLVDADLDSTDQPDTTQAEVVAMQKGKTTDTVTITLTETGPRTGVFVGTAPTETIPATANASSETKSQEAFAAIDDDAKSFWKPVSKSFKEGQKHFIEVDLRQPTHLGSLTWTAPTNTRGRLLLRGEGTDVSSEISSDTPVVDLKKVFARIVRIEFDAFEGDAPSVSAIVITDDQGRQLVPTGVNPNAPERKANLAFDVGYEVMARFVDEENETPNRTTTRESRRLGVRYHDGQINLAAARGEGESMQLSPAWRVEREGRQWIVVNDSDHDITVDRDNVKITVFSEIGDSQELLAEETGPATGVFAAALPLAAGQAAMDNPRLFRVGTGDIIWITYDDPRNATPGYRTFRHRWFLENQPTVGDFANLPLVTTAWPFEVKPTADGEMKAVPRESGKGRVSLAYADPDAFADATRSVTARLNGLIGQASAETVLLPGSTGTASKSLDLVLGDKDAAAMGENEDAAPLARAKSELNVVGDDLIRIATTDEQMTSQSLIVRPVLTHAALESLEANADDPTRDVLPVVRLTDPIRQMQQVQADRLKALRAEMGFRLLAYRLENESLAAHRKTLDKQLAAAGEDVELSGSIKRLSEGVDAQIAIGVARIERLKALGAQEAERLPQPAPVEAAVAAVVDPKQVVMDGPIIPNRAVQVIIDDPDLTQPTADVRLRSVAGVLVDSVNAKAVRQADGTYAVRVETDRSSERGDPARLSVLPGGEVIVDYTDTTPIVGEVGERVQYLAMASDATIRSLNSNYVDDVSQLRLGQEVYIEVTDYDADRSAGLDLVIAQARSKRGDTLSVALTETEPHSGVFRGMFRTDAAVPVEGDDVLQAGYGGGIEIGYADRLRQTPSSSIDKTITLRITGGSDGTIEAFGRQFRDSREEMQLWFRTGQAAYQVGRRLYLAGSMSRAEEYLSESNDHFAMLVSRFPDDEMAASSNYYLGNIAALRERHRDALDRFQEVVTRWPKSEFVPQARFKIGQALEGLGQFNQATDAYVLLTYHHPQDRHVPLAMIRMMNHYARSENYADSVAIAQRFVEKFKDHDQAGAVALKAGQWLTVSGKVDEALAWYTEAEKTFAKSDRDMPALLYWHAATMIQGGRIGNQGQRADKVRELLNRVVYDYGKSEYSGLATIALEQINQNN